MILVSRAGHLALPPVALHNMNEQPPNVQRWEPNYGNAFFQVVPSATTSGTGFEYDGDAYVWNTGDRTGAWYFSDRLIPDVVVSGQGVHTTLEPNTSGANGFMCWGEGLDCIKMEQRNYNGTVSLAYGMNQVINYNLLQAEGQENPYGGNGGIMGYSDTFSYFPISAGFNIHGDGWYEFSDSMEGLNGPGRSFDEALEGGRNGSLLGIANTPSAVSAYADWGTNAYCASSIATTSPVASACTFRNEFTGEYRKAGIPIYIGTYYGYTYYLAAIPNMEFDEEGNMRLHWKCLYSNYIQPNAYANGNYWYCYEYTDEKDGETVYTIGGQRGQYNGWWEFKLPHTLARGTTFTAIAANADGTYSPEDDMEMGLSGFMPHTTCKVKYRLPENDKQTTEIWGMTIGAFSVCTMEY